jgi:hypothetical protein
LIAMLHLFLEPGDWFAPKRCGYGAGLPIAWQGWVLTGVWLAAIAGVALLAARDSAGERIAALLLGLMVTAAFLAIVRRRTRGGWRWRRGGRD